MIKIGFIHLLNALMDKAKTDASFNQDVKALKSISHVARYNLNKRIENEHFTSEDQALQWYLRLVE